MAIAQCQLDNLRKYKDSKTLRKKIDGFPNFLIYTQRMPTVLEEEYTHGDVSNSNVNRNLIETSEQHQR